MLQLSVLFIIEKHKLDRQGDWTKITLWEQTFPLATRGSKIDYSSLSYLFHSPATNLSPFIIFPISRIFFPSIFSSTRSLRVSAVTFKLSHGYLAYQLNFVFSGFLACLQAVSLVHWAVLLQYPYFTRFALWWNKNKRPGLIKGRRIL